MKVIRAQQIDLTDEQGRVRIRLSASPATPHIELIGEDGKSGLTLMLDDGALPSVTLRNPQGGTSASFAVDAKGAHVKFDRPGGASSYLFLNDEGTSGIVLLDGAGKRRYSVLVDAEGVLTESREGSNGK
jgi:hypothetical protein